MADSIQDVTAIIDVRTMNKVRVYVEYGVFMGIEGSTRAWIDHILNDERSEIQ